MYAHAHVLTLSAAVSCGGCRWAGTQRSTAASCACAARNVASHGCSPKDRAVRDRAVLWQLMRVFQNECKSIKPGDHVGIEIRFREYPLVASGAVPEPAIPACSPSNRSLDRNWISGDALNRRSLRLGCTTPSGRQIADEYCVTVRVVSVGTAWLASMPCLYSSAPNYQYPESVLVGAVPCSVLLCCAGTCESLH
jgi:hypothetical protein